ncbi:hypothetical protein L873DRAFT_288310 [Choiromyces venosus 120613-1]|uniref:Transmembrane protein n=1 Tax=Choiromyces venosus 120613-1 TaxID=1336337 RepID=A0A3N4JY31_9PEZI|nr:hypothetical protein L873DRAFT_288310 [Choiromyces venosus 120613-1]
MNPSQFGIHRVGGISFCFNFRRYSFRRGFPREVLVVMGHLPSLLLCWAGISGSCTGPGRVGLRWGGVGDDASLLLEWGFVGSRGCGSVLLGLFSFFLFLFLFSFQSWVS